MTKKYVAYADFYENRLGSMLLGWFYLEELALKDRSRYETRKEGVSVNIKKMHVIFGIDNLSRPWNIFTETLTDWAAHRGEIFETEEQAIEMLWAELNPNSKHLIRHIFTL